VSRARPSAQLRVRVQARAAREEIVGERDGALVVRVSAPPEGGKANQAVCALIARRLRIGRTRVRVVRGQRSRDKSLVVDDMETAALRRALGIAP
jgi:uncharacterized protein (TIGR00251 family)